MADSTLASLPAVTAALTTDVHYVEQSGTAKRVTAAEMFPQRGTTAQKNALVAPSAGTLFYDTTLGKLCVRVAAAWETITSA